MRKGRTFAFATFNWRVDVCRICVNIQYLAVYRRIRPREPSIMFRADEATLFYCRSSYGSPLKRSHRGLRR